MYLSSSATIWRGVSSSSQSGSSCATAGTGGRSASAGRTFTVVARSLGLLQLEHRDLVVGVDADLPRDAERLVDDLGSRQRRVLLERAGRREGIRAPRANGHHLVVRLDHVPVATDQEDLVLVGD